MNIIIYNINSFGGNYEYSKYLFKAYQRNAEVERATLLMPANSEFCENGVVKLLLADLIRSNNKLLKKLYFLYRSIFNPYKLFFYLLKQPSSTVIFNDFDQLTAWFWAPLFKLLKKRHKFSVILHDPDRDDFFPMRYLSKNSMASVMSFMDLAFYHGFLPEKSYYKSTLTKVDIPHGIYDDTEVDEAMLVEIRKEAGDAKIIGILGNIRDEKNYGTVIEALPKMDHVKLLIAGKVANSGVNTQVYKDEAVALGISKQIIWKEGYLSQGAFNAAITVCDIVLLFYKPSFTSQSGVLNTIAPFKKTLVISDAESSLKKSVIAYSLGSIVPHNNPSQLAITIKELLSLSPTGALEGWNNYINESSWEKHVSIAVNAINKI